MEPGDRSILDRARLFPSDTGFALTCLSPPNTLCSSTLSQRGGRQPLGAGHVLTLTFLCAKLRPSSCLLGDAELSSGHRLSVISFPFWSLVVRNARWHQPAGGQRLPVWPAGAEDARGPGAGRAGSAGAERHRRNPPSLSAADPRIAHSRQTSAVVRVQWWEHPAGLPPA